jgi:xylitol oxidase
MIPAPAGSSRPGAQIDDVIPRNNWAGNVNFAAARIHKPDSLDSLRRILIGCRRIRALGCGHSFSAIVATSDDLVLLNGLPQAVGIDSTALKATAQLHRAGFALANLASIPDISIAGACATGTHGSGNDQRVLAAAISGIQLVVSDGDVVELQRDVDGDRFYGCPVALGALGVVTQLTLDIEPAYDMAQNVYLGIPLDEVGDRLDDVFGAGYSVSAFTDWLSGGAAVWLKTRVHMPESKWTIGRRPAQCAVHPIPGLSPDLCTKQLGTVAAWHECLPHFRPKSGAPNGDELQSEFFLPRDVAQKAINALREIGNLLTPVLLISEVRTVRADDLWLSPAYGRDSIAFHFTWISDAAAVWPALVATEERLMPLGARPHWGKITTVDPRTIVATYERASDFEQLAYEFDPTSKFRNDFVNSLFPVG